MLFNIRKTEESGKVQVSGVTIDQEPSVNHLDSYPRNDFGKSIITVGATETVTKDVSEKNNTIEALEKQVASLQAEVEKLRNETTSSSTTVQTDNQSSEIEMLKVEHAEEIQKLKEQSTEDLQKLQTKVERKNALQAEIESLRQEIDTSSRSLTEAQQATAIEKEKNSTQLAELSDLNKTQKTELNDLQAKLDRQADVHKDEQDRAQKRLAELEAEVEKDKKQIGDLSREKELAKSDSEIVDGLKKRVATLEEENSALSKNKNEVENKASSQAQELENEISKLRQQIEGNSVAKESELKSLQEQLAKAKSSENDLQTEKKDREEELRSTRKVVEDLQTEIQRLLHAKADNATAVDNLQKDLKEAEEKHSKVLQEKDSRVEGLQTSINSLKSEIEGVKQEKMALSKEKEKDNSSSQMMIDEYQKKLAEAEEGSKKNQAAKELELKELSQVVEGLQNEIKTLKQSDHDAERFVRDEVERLEQEATRLREKLENEIAEKEKLSLESKNQLTDLETSMRSVEAENNRLKDERRTLVDDKKSEVEHLKLANSKLLKEKDDEVSRVKNECTTLQEEVLNVKSAVETADAEATRAREEAMSLQKVLKTFDEDSKEKEQQKVTALSKAKADLQSAMDNHQAELDALRAEHASELNKAIENAKSENEAQLKELQTKYESLMDEQKDIVNRQEKSTKVATSEIEAKYKQDMQELQDKHESLSRIHAEVIESNSATQRLLEEELKKARDELESTSMKQDEAQRKNSDEVANLQKRLDDVVGEKKELLERQNANTAKMQEDRELALKRLTEDHESKIATLRKEKSNVEQSSMKTLENERMMQKEKFADLEARCAQLQSSADVANMLEEQSKVLKPRIHELEEELAVANAELENLRKRVKVESGPAAPPGLTDSKWASKTASENDPAPITNDKSSLVNDSNSVENAVDGTPSNGGLSAGMTLEGTVRLPFF